MRIQNFYDADKNFYVTNGETVTPCTVSYSDVNSLLETYTNAITNACIAGTNNCYSRTRSERIYSAAEITPFEGGGIVESVPYESDANSNAEAYELRNRIIDNIENVLKVNGYDSLQLTFDKFQSSGNIDIDDVSKLNATDYTYKWENLSDVLDISFKLPEFPVFRLGNSNTIVTAQSFMTYLKDLTYILQKLYILNYKIIYKTCMSYTTFFAASPTKPCYNGKIFRYFIGAKHQIDRKLYWSDVVVISPLFKHNIILNSSNNIQYLDPNYNANPPFAGQNVLHSTEKNFDISKLKLAYLNTEIASDIPNFNVESNNGSNGIFKAYKEIHYNKSTVLEDLVDGLQSFIQNENVIITYKFIAYVINHIFKTWLDQLSILDITIYACHSNCHFNGNKIPSVVFKSDLEERTYIFQRNGVSSYLLWKDEGDITDLNGQKGRINDKVWLLHNTDHSNIIAYGNYACFCNNKASTLLSYITLYRFFIQRSVLNANNSPIIDTTKFYLAMSDEMETESNGAYKSTVEGGIAYHYHIYDVSYIHNYMLENEDAANKHIFTLNCDSVSYANSYRVLFNPTPPAGTASKFTNDTNYLIRNGIAIVPFMPVQNNNSTQTPPNRNSLQQICDLEYIDEYIDVSLTAGNTNNLTFAGWYYTQVNQDTHVVEEKYLSEMTDNEIPFVGKEFTLSAKWEQPVIVKFVDSKAKMQAINIDGSITADLAEHIVYFTRRDSTPVYGVEKLIVDIDNYVQMPNFNGYQGETAGVYQFSHWTYGGNEIENNSLTIDFPALGTTISINSAWDFIPDPVEEPAENG